MDLAKKRKLEENGVVFPPDSAATTTTITTLSHDDLRKVIEPFTHEQLSQIVLTASLRHPDVLDAVRSIADRDPTQRKLFIRGLGWETTSEKLRSLFATYGDLEEAIVILDKVTGKSKGYGFVTYRHIDGALMALKEPSKKIDGRMTVTQLASAGFTNGASVTANLQTLDVSSRKIYVGNVPYDMPGERLLAHFSSYGEMEEGPLGFDKITGKSRGFALFIYKNVDGARASLVDPVKTIDGHQLNCKLANDNKRGNSGGMAAPPAAAVASAQVQGSGDRVKPEVIRVNLNQQSSMQGSYASQFGGGPGGIYGGNLGGLGLAGPGGISVYGGGGGQVPPLSHSQHPLNSNLGGGAGLSSFGSNGGGPGLSTNGSQAPNSLGGGSGGFSSGLGGGGGGVGVSYGGGAGVGGGGSGFGGSGQRSLYGLPPGSVRMSSGGYPESAHYSLSSGSAYQSQQQ
ncbi:UBP1-associated protein 2C-like [Cynara cardunculus var. scolymus]|uniref:Nucleotide-binding, alpha-beta plait n=1 Tax=Cynara cardunculus var. scolymus TaxID=59895 RepID=A0A118JVI3_CYNCS|nr:UBP1-associated protein 2C-like [Cynara cardunculus var. scolymus]XP_024980224.1 UBP1-associated protein 2C-like [Cynara cardunculus var. scolymus]XP_024980225.1 UBP1-associated protein 2C-like [Cynara cardunculus var. scolymus]XP_024980226.1 UBP1-associated protein 2C-like [Cynara cardunculus var. scolymus]KVH93129.1 Nucleotide-binding, alpha-beta plait [Cynara cardunculus var. scolymus]